MTLLSVARVIPVSVKDSLGGAGGVEIVRMERAG